MSIMLIGNKTDLSREARKVDVDQARQFAEQRKMIYYETSALTGTNVFIAFSTIVN